MPDDGVGQQVRPGVRGGVGRGRTVENVEAHRFPDASEVLHCFRGDQRVTQPRPVGCVCVAAALGNEQVVQPPGRRGVAEYRAARAKK
jgi:hypothetical protein